MLKQWWAETAQLSERLLCDDWTWCLIDANAPLASSETASFGLLHAEPSNRQGELFEAFLLEQQMVVPSTFLKYHQGPSETWTHPTGKRMRRDYILTSSLASCATQRTWVMTDHDNTFEHEDHLPLCLHVRTTFAARAGSAKPIRWDQQRLRDPVAIAAFQAALCTLPIPTWELNVEEHCRLYETNLLQLARQHFEKCDSSRVRPQLSAATLQSIAFKRHILDCGRAWDLMQDPDYRIELKELEKEVKLRVQCDLGIHYDQLLVQLQEAGEMHNLKMVYQLLTRFGSRKIKNGAQARPLPALRKQDGTLATTFTEQQKIWMDQFSEVEAGVPMHWSELQRIDRPGLGPPRDVHDQELFPSPWALQQTLRRLKRGKTPGPNLLPPDVLKAGAAPLSHQLCALTTKIVAHCKEPLTWKGGQLIPLSKGKGDATDPLGYRSIFVSDFTAKMFHMTLRSHLVEVWEKGIQSLQLGGRRRMGVDVAHHFLQAHRHWTQVRKLSGAYLFFDIRAAFYSVLRQALYPCEERPLSLIAALRRFKVRADDIDSMLSAVYSDDATEGISDHVRLLLKDAMTNTHFFIQGLDMPCQTHRGTRPGDPLGDLLYNMVMALVMKDARNSVLERTPAAWIGAPAPCLDFTQPFELPETAFFDLAFVDDCALAIHAPHYEQVTEIVQTAVGAMDQAAKRRGLLLNYAPGKTETVLNLRGAGSTAAKVALHADGFRLRWEMDETLYTLRVVPCYKHLGTWLQQGTRTTKEAAHRGALARQSWGPLHRSFYRKRYVAIKTKMAVFQTLTMSRLLYNAHIWSPCSEDMLQTWQNTIRKPLCSLVKGSTFGVSPLLLDVPTLCGLLHVLPPEDLLHLARLRYIKRFLSSCPSFLWQMLVDAAPAPHSWLKACSSSLSWFRRFYSDHFAAPASDDLCQWLPLIQLDSNWYGRVRAAGKACRWYRQACAESATWIKQFEASFESHGGVLPSQRPRMNERWGCDQCDKWFMSKKALASHSARMHGYRNIVLFYATGDTCQSCCRWFHNRSRLVEHLRVATSCMATLQACFPPISEQLLKA